LIVNCRTAIPTDAVTGGLIMNENLAPQDGETAEGTSTAASDTENTTDRVPFTVEMMELDSNPIVLQPKTY
jgi:hypothetical protein